MPHDGTPAKPVQIPPAGTPDPVETLDTVPAAELHPSGDAPPQVPPYASGTDGVHEAAPPVIDHPTPAPGPYQALPPAAPAHPASRGLAVLLALVCVLALVGAGYLYWLSRVAATGLAEQLDAIGQSIDTLNQRVGAMDQRLAAVEKRPVPPPVDLRPLEQRLTTLENKPPPTAQLDAAGHAEVATVAGRIDQLIARQDQLGAREQSDIGKLGDQLAAQDTRIAGQDSKIAEQDSKIASASQAGVKTVGQVDALAVRESRLATLQTAAAALAAGRPLGVLPGAPPALARFADKPPPTEASLRLSFADAAQAAHEAGMPAKADAPLASRMWDRMQSMVTIRQGDRVVVGDAITGILTHAQSLLDAGDLAGAVTALDGLAGPAAAAMAPWRQQAQSLLDARAAMLTLARG